MDNLRKFNEAVSNDIYIKSVEVITDVNPLKAGVKVEFKKPICFIVGDNGVGKSTLLECIASAYGYKDETYLRRQGMAKNVKIETIDGKFPFKFIDFHGDDRKFAGSFGSDMGLQIAHMKASSGQVSISLLNNMLTKLDSVKNGVVILDEPCRGQSIKNKIKVANVISALSTKLNCQVIITTHSDWILKIFDKTAQYYDINANKDTTYKEFILSQLS